MAKRAGKHVLTTGIAAMIAAAAASPGATVDVDGMRVWYETGGRGKTAIVLVHGWTCDSSFWRLQRPALEREFRVIALDLPGHGKSGKPTVRYDLPLFSRAVLAAMDKEKIQSAALAGHSMGTSVIRQVYEDAPGRVLGLISVDGAVFRGMNEANRKRYSDFAASLRGPNHREIAGKFIDSMFTEATTPPLREEIRGKMLAAPQHVAASAFEAAVLSGLWDKAAPVRVPVLAVNRQSQNPDREAAHKAAFANLEYREIPGVSHFLMMEKPDEVNALIAAFVRKLQ